MEAEQIKKKTKNRKKKKCLYLTASKGKQYCAKTASSYPLLGRESQQLHKQWHCSNPYRRINSFPSKTEAHLPKQEVEP